MTTAWETLTSNSSLESGTAWEHLNAQTGDGAETIILADGMGLEVDIQELNVVVSDTLDVELSINVGELSIEIESEPMELPV